MKHHNQCSETRGNVGRGRGGNTPSDPWPMLVPPSKKDTVPVGLPTALSPIVAVKVTDCPNTDGLAEDATEVVVPVLTLYGKSHPRKDSISVAARLS